jgi:hypothetical protein
VKSNIEQRRIVAYLDSFPLARVRRDRQARLASQTQEELDALKTLRVCPDNLRHVKQGSLACGIASRSRKPLGSRMMVYARLASLRELQSQTGEELDALLGSRTVVQGEGNHVLD